VNTKLRRNAEKSALASLRRAPGEVPAPGSYALARAKLDDTMLVQILKPAAPRAGLVNVRIWRMRTRNWGKATWISERDLRGAPPAGDKRLEAALADSVGALLDGESDEPPKPSQLRRRSGIDALLGSLKGRAK
jgi:hypothetical protein